LRKTDITNDRTIAYIEIINSKSLYVNYLVEKFKSENHIPHIDKNEDETDNIVVDLKTGLNLDKIPGYLSDYMSNLAASTGSNVKYFQIFMPHKVSMADVIGFLRGTIDEPEVEKLLVDFLVR